MIKHVGKYGDKKVVILYRQVPGEDHMCLVAFSELLPRLVHDEVMQVLESPAGQQAKDLADALFRNVMADGRNTLQVLHAEGFIQKVQTQQVFVTPNQSSSVRLDELNTILAQMDQGAEGAKRMAEIEAKKPEAKALADVVADPAVGALTDADIAKNLRTQAEQLKAQSAQLLAEADRLTKEAAALIPEPKVNAKKKTVKAN